jgi:protein-S-isoprenylcysteine O-methyltransferase Ste14
VRWQYLLAWTAVVPVGVVVYFFVFWRWFDFWRKHALLTYTMFLGILLGTAAAVHHFRDLLFARRVELPGWVHVIGWVVIAIYATLTTVADRQIGFRVRSFMPFFEEHGHIQLKTTGAYAIVRHPIYAGGIGWQLGTFLITGYWVVAVAAVLFTLGAQWFTRQEERRLLALLDDPADYERYRQRVGRLFPRIWHRR